MVYPTQMPVNTKIKLFHKVLCRFYDLEYMGNLTMDEGHEVMEYRVSRDAYEHTKENECYCSAKSCYKGLSDVSPCLSGYLDKTSSIIILFKYLDNGTKLFGFMLF